MVQNSLSGWFHSQGLLNVAKGLSLSSGMIASPVIPKEPVTSTVFSKGGREEGHQGIRENGMGRFAIQPLGMEVWPKHSVGWAPNAWPSWANASAGPAISRILARNPSTCDCTNPVGLRPILATHPSLKVHAPKRSHRGRRLSQCMRVHSLEGHRNTMPLLLLRLVSRLC